ncbi:MAG: polysaccharide biosynthesis protein [Clostridiales bacterium]|jgi:stage V sporulation protein B|nr:polysaccharide biosynthesis protein [Clostridiales bacterium]
MENTRRSTFIDQAAVLVTAMFISRFLGFLYRMPMTHFIGDDGNAYYAAGFQIYTFFLIFSSAGLPAAISKLVSERVILKRYNDAHAVFQVAIFLAAIMGIAFSLILLFGARYISALLSQPLSYYSMLALSPTLLIVGIMAVFRGYFQGMGTTKPTAVSQIAEQIFNAGFSVLLAYLMHGYGPEFGAAGGTVGTGIGAIAGLLVMVFIYKLNSKFIHRRLKTDHLPQKESYSEIAAAVLKTAWPIILGSAVFSISGMIDTAMVSNCLKASNAFDAAQIAQLYGQYSGKYITLTTLPVVISSAMATASIPSVASSNALNDTSAVSAKINMGLRMAMLFTIPAAIGLSVLGDPILKLLFPSHPDGGALLRWGGIGVIFLALAQITTGMLQGVGRVKLPIIGAITGAVIKIILNMVLISNPAINVLGAVFSTIACYMVASAIDIFLLWHVTHARINFMSTLIKPIICAVGMGVATYGTYEAVYFLSGSNAASVILSITFGAAVYFICMLFVKGIERSDLRAVPIGRKLIRMMDSLGL